jgi:hypothetical protein
MLTLSMVALGGTVVPAVALADSPPPALVSPAQTQAKPLSTVETQKLAQREQKSKDLDKYEGGQVVIAISSAAAIVILVLVLLLLL